MLYKKHEDGSEASKIMWRQLRAINRKYEGAWPVVKNTAILAAYLGYPEWSMQYFESGVMQLTLRGELYDFAIYVRADEYEGRVNTGFIKDRNPREIKRWIDGLWW